jgi:SAM-dependent methyltransferase
MSEQITRWNERYAARQGLHALAPSSPLPAAVAGVEPGRALDLACGAGRHALFLAERGWQVVAVDGAHNGIALLTQEARRRGVEHRIEAHVADLETEPPGFVIEPDQYDLICDFYYLHRPLLADIRRGVRPLGLFAAAIHVLHQGESAQMNPAFLLRPGELRDTIRGWGWEILHSAEGPSSESGHRHGTAELIARRPAPAPAHDPRP